jgi:hypothetical protein
MVHKIGQQQVPTLGCQPASSAQDAQSAMEPSGTNVGREEGNKKRKWRYFWAEDEES